MEIMVDYFRYKIRRGLSGYQKISERSDIKRLRLIDENGFKFIEIADHYVYFSVESQLYRKLKLIKLGNRTQNNNVRFIDFMVSRSKKCNQDDIPEDSKWFTSYYSGYYDVGYIELEKEEQKREYKYRIRNHNKQYKTKLKR